MYRGETFFAAAMRKVLEETGFAAAAVPFIDVDAEARSSENAAATMRWNATNSKTLVVRVPKCSSGPRRRRRRHRHDDVKAEPLARGSVPPAAHGSDWELKRVTIRALRVVHVWNTFFPGAVRASECACAYVCRRRGRLVRACVFFFFDMYLWISRRCARGASPARSVARSVACSFAAPTLCRFACVRGCRLGVGRGAAACACGHAYGECARAVRAVCAAPRSQGDAFREHAGSSCWRRCADGRAGHNGIILAVAVIVGVIVHPRLAGAPRRLPRARRLSPPSRG
jgi:hypothetical protein